METLTSITPYLELFFLLCVGSAVAGALGKMYLSEFDKMHWWWAVYHRGLLYAVPVYVVTGSFGLAIAETVVAIFLDIARKYWQMTYPMSLCIATVFRMWWVTLLVI